MQHTDGEDTCLLIQPGSREDTNVQQSSCPADIERQLTISPFPKIQFAALCILRMLDPMSFTQIFPYINEMIKDLNVGMDVSQVGYYSGLVESAFAIAQLLSIYPWAYLSDTIGRRPVVLAGVGGLAITTLLFGLGQDFNVIIVSRAFAGLFSGNVAVIPSMLCEITDSSNQAFAFPFFGIWWPIGAVIGPLIGGTFSKPGEKFPRYFGNQFFQTYPYFLPGFLVSLTSFVGFALGYFYLEETLDRRGQGLRDAPGRCTYGGTQDESRDERNKNQSIVQILSHPMIMALCSSGCASSFLSTAFDVLFVLFCYTPVQKGGLGFSIARIGYALATAGGLAAVLQVFFMPFLLRWVDHAVLYHFCIKLWPFAFLAMPFLNMIARQDALNIVASDGGLTETWRVWVGIAITLSFARAACLVYTVNVLLITRFSPNKATLGSSTGLVQFSICLARAVSPAFASSVYATLSQKTEFLGGYGWTVVMTAISLVSSVLSKAVVNESKRT